MNGASPGSYKHGILRVHQDVVKCLLFPVVAFLLNTGTRASVCIFNTMDSDSRRPGPLKEVAEEELPRR